MSGEWRARCPQLVRDEDGHYWPCRVLAEILTSHQQASTSGPVVLVRTRCGAGHIVDCLLEDLDLIID